MLVDSYRRYARSLAKHSPGCNVRACTNATQPMARFAPRRMRGAVLCLYLLHSCDALLVRPCSMSRASPVMAEKPPEWARDPEAFKSLEVSAYNGAGRKPYLLTGLPRPKHRGALVGLLHRTKLWYIIAAAYLWSCLQRSATSAVPLTAVEKGLRVAAAVISSANIFISDRYHNADLKPGCYTKAHELFWMRCDYFGISAILAYNQFLWSGNVGWHCRTRLAAAYSAFCLGIVGIVAPNMSGNRDGSTKIIKYVTGTQFLPAMTYLVLTMGGALTLNAVIYTLYASGLVLYVSKRPQSKTFGFHEMFHTLVVLGHLASMGFDLLDIASPVARVAAASWKHTAPVLTFASLPLVLTPWMLLFVLLPNKRRLVTKLDVLRRTLMPSGFKPSAPGGFEWGGTY